MRRVAASAIPFVLCVALGANAGADPTAYDIFARARHVLQAQLYPDPILYRTTVQVSEGTKVEAEHFRAQALSHGDVRVEGVSEEEQAAPHESSGVNFKFTLSVGWNTGAGGQTATADEDAHRKEVSPDYLGVPLISPSYSFGLASERTETPSQTAQEVSKLPTIATVTATSRPYNVSLMGTEIVDGSYTYHLHLEPFSHPDRYRLRELWVDVYTYQPIQLQTQGNFTAAPMSDIPWLVTFQNIRGSIYIKNETALEPLVFRHDRTFETASITFDEIRADDDSSPILPTMGADAAINLREP